MLLSKVAKVCGPVTPSLSESPERKAWRQRNKVKVVLVDKSIPEFLRTFVPRRTLLGREGASVWKDSVKLGWAQLAMRTTIKLAQNLRNVQRETTVFSDPTHGCTERKYSQAIPISGFLFFTIS